MSTSFNDLFETILNEGHADVLIPFGQHESLRTSLVRRLSAYKESHDALGFLSEEMKNLSMSAQPVIMHGDMSGTRFLLKQKSTRKFYTIIKPDCPNE